ncbi:GFA family protein [uncultured Erythrobacter sp.]|uniref:GFA family protein n=1 Tax=uncultured Erythrobacter sp. TaxID=263913 RepID=UPI002633CB4C|nr:GFA family protein [uncultured Erythrobacter sp.]
MTIVEGQCRCGDIRYQSVDIGPAGFYACHCGQCRRLLGTSFALNLPTRKDLVEIQGELQGRDYQTAPGRGNRSYFCPNCHSHVFSANSWRKGVLVVRAGTVTNLDDCEMLGHVWTSSKQSWVRIGPDETAFSESPTEDEWRSLFGNRNRLFDEF